MYKNREIWAIVLAAGKGTRIGFDKMLYKIDGLEVAHRSILAFENNEYVDGIIVTGGENLAEIEEIGKRFVKVKAVVKGGDTRAKSVFNALEKVPGGALVAIHDGARPFVSREVINDAVKGAFEFLAAVPCVKVKDTIKQSSEEFIGQTFDRSRLYSAQTPQVFDADMYKELSKVYFDETLTDDSQLFEKAGISVKITKGDYENFKITTIDDIKKENKMRIGHGYDVHKLVEGRKLIMAGIHIPYEKGLLGHSDADVVAHAVTDSMLGAMAMGDIGKHFPDNDPAFKDIDSMYLMKVITDKIYAKGVKVGNIDVTILCQKPKLAPYILPMRENIAKVLGCDLDRISVKATTEEGLGFTGEGLGIACHCVCLLEDAE